MIRGNALVGAACTRAFRAACLMAVAACGLACLLLPGPTPASAGGGAHRCEVSVEDFNVDDIKKLGSFDTVVKSESLTTKAFRFPDTELFVSAGVLYMQDSPSDGKTPPSKMILTLALSKRAYSNIETEMKNAEVVTNARAIVPLKLFEGSEVETIFLGKSQPIIITLACKKLQ
jgi:hypothetical protein